MPFLPLFFDSLRSILIWPKRQLGFSGLVFANMLSLPLASVHGQGFTQPVGVTPGTILAEWDVSPGNSTRTTTAGYHRGYLFADSRNDGITTWNISNWNNVRLVDNSADQGTNHHHFLVGDYYLNSSGSGNGAHVWDLSDMRNVVARQPAEYPYIRRGGNMRRDWFPLPFVYTGQNGYHPITELGMIVDARTDTILAEIDYQKDLGFPGQPVVIGNLMIVAASQSSNGVATYDVSDPTSPILLDLIRNGSNRFIGPGYEPSVWRHYVVLAMDDFGNSPDRVVLVDFSDPTNLRLAATIDEPPGLSRYTQFQDEFVFVGDAKYNLEELLAEPDKHFDGIADAELIFNGEDEYNYPLGNVVVTFDSGGGNGGTTRAIVHDSSPDTNPPYVSYHNPPADSLDQAVTTRIGLVINESLDTRSVNAANVIVRPLGGAPIEGILSQADKDVVTFHPVDALADDTTYEVVLPAGGVSDVSGNALTEDFIFSFSTGSSLGTREQPPEIETIDFAYPVLEGETSTLSVVASDPDGEAPLEYSWDFGDGAGAWTGSPSVERTFNDRGHQGVVVRVRDEQGLVTARAFTVTVVDEIPSGPMGVNSSPIVFDPVRDWVWVVNPDNDSITAVSAVTLTKLVEIPVGAQPVSLSLDGSGLLWVANEHAGTVQSVDPVDGVVRTIRFGHGSRPVAVLCDGTNHLFVSLQGSGALVRVNTLSGQVTHRVEVGPSPRALALDGARTRLLVTRFISSDAEGEVHEFDPSDLSPLRTYTLAPNTEPDRDTGNEGRGLPNYLSGLAITPDDGQAWVAAQKVNIYAGALRDPEYPLQPDTTVRSITPILDLATGEERYSERIDLDNSSQPAAAMFSPLGDYAFILLQGNNTINVLDRLDDNLLVTRFNTGLAPQGFCYDPERGQLFTKDFMDRTVSVFDLDTFLTTGAVPVQKTATVGTVANETLSGPVLRGKQIFYNAQDDRMSIDDYISCASCHLDGGHDGRTWDFTQRGEGLRNNISLLGRAGAAHGNQHWTGNFDESQDFENDIRLHFGGLGFLPDDEWADPEVQDPLGSKSKAGRSPELDDLAAYLASLGADSLRASPYRTPTGKLSYQAIRGREVFEAASCMDCHSGSTYTDGLRHDVGTLTADSGTRVNGPLDGIDTPTLLDLHDTAPYLHDGSAPNLETVFTRFDPSASADSDLRAHDLRAFTPEEQSDLIRYLLEIDSPPGTIGSGFVETDGAVVMETENGDFAEGQSVWQFVSTGQASGGLYVSSTEEQYGNSPNSETPERIFSHTFTLTGSGDYAFRVRLNSSRGRDSIYWRLTYPDGTRSPWRRWLLDFNTGDDWDWRTWSSASENNIAGDDFDDLVPGVYLLETTYREGDTRLDKYMVQSANQAAPGSGAIGPGESPPASTEPNPSENQTSFADWLAFNGLPSDAAFGASYPGRPYSYGFAYAMAYFENTGSQTVSQPLELAPHPDHTETMLASFLRFPTQSNVRYELRASNDLVAWDTVAEADAGASEMTNLMPESLSIEEGIDPEQANAIRTEVSIPVGTEPVFLRLSFINTSAE